MCGSSPAAVAAFTRVAVPGMVKHIYPPSFSGATIAAGGALKALIPPSLSMILYCVVARTYIFDVFTAAVVPGLLTIAANVIAIAVVVHFNPAIAPVSARVSRRERIKTVGAAPPPALFVALLLSAPSRRHPTVYAPTAAYPPLSPAVALV